ncbi:MAG: 4Fe-4S dicluster domain-containing protein [archaeon]
MLTGGEWTSRWIDGYGMVTMTAYRQDKETFGKFMLALLKNSKVYAPLNKDVVRFSQLTNEDIPNIYLEKNAYFPLKEYFFRHQQTLFTFKKNDLQPIIEEEPARVFFGVRKCDLNAIHHQDMVFLQDAKDPYYAAARKNVLLFGYHCDEAPSPHCFCGSLNLVDCYDLMFYDKGDYFLIEVGSEKGQDIVDKHASFFVQGRKVTQEEKQIRNADRLLKHDISALYDHPDWQKGVKLCLSCAACTALCPTCYCFDIHDELSTKDPTAGERIRQWSSCQLPEFTKVAGNHIFRQDRAQRFKHRIYHQLDYFKQKYGIQLCVGCGRCIEGCPTRIDFVQIINEMNP